MDIALLVRKQGQIDALEVLEVNLCFAAAKSMGRRLWIIDGFESREARRAIHDLCQRFEDQFGEPYKAIVFEDGFIQEWMDEVTLNIGCQAIILSTARR